MKRKIIILAVIILAFGILSGGILLYRYYHPSMTFDEYLNSTSIDQDFSSYHIYVAVGDNIATYRIIYPEKSLDEMRPHWEEQKAEQEDILSHIKRYAKAGAVYQKNASFPRYYYPSLRRRPIRTIETCTWYIPYGDPSPSSHPLRLIREYKGVYTFWSFDSYEPYTRAFPDDVMKKAFPDASFIEE